MKQYLTFEVCGGLTRGPAQGPGQHTPVTQSLSEQPAGPVSNVSQQRVVQQPLFLLL